MKNPDRLCCIDDDCYRNDVIFALEETFDIEVSPEMTWGYYDMFVTIEDRLYYYKPRIAELIRDDLDNYDVDDEKLLEDITTLEGLLGYGIDERKKGFDYIYNFVISTAKIDDNGSPNFIEEVGDFLIFSNPGARILPADQWVLNKDNIFRDIGGENNPFIDALHEGQLYIDDEDNIYCYDITAYDYNPSGNFGFVYELNDTMNILPFRELSLNETKILELYTAIS